MSVDSITETKLHDPGHAVDDYLDRLLDDGALQGKQECSLEERSAEVSAQPDSNESTDSQWPKATHELSTSTESNEGLPNPHVPSQEQSTGGELTDAIVEKAPSPEKGPLCEQLENEAESREPSEQSISLLKFQVTGINFAMPVKSCSGEYPCPEDITIEHKGSKWLLGDIVVGGKRIRIVNVASMVIPDSRRESILSAGRPQFSRVLGIVETDWGFVCEGEVERIDLPTKEVRWRTEQGKRQWLAGTIVDLKCALLDVNAIKRMLDH